MRNRFIPYPMQHNLWRLPTNEVIDCVEGLLQARGQTTPPASNFREWIVQQFGEGLARCFFIPYNSKVWAFPPETLDVGWVGERVATVDLERILRNLILRQDDRVWGPNALFRFPLRGGTGAIWQALRQRLPGHRLSFGKRCTRIDPSQRRAFFDDGSDRAYDQLISSLPLDQLLRKLTGCPHLEAFASLFRHSSTHVVGVGLQGSLPTTLRTKSWIYFPEPVIPFYRVTVFSNYSPYNVPHPETQWSLLCEISESDVRPVDPQSMKKGTLKALCDAGLVPTDARIVSLWHRRLEYGYPTPFLGRNLVLPTVDTALREMGILSRGRFGAWKYEVSNQDHSFMQGVEAVDHLMTGAEEVTVYHASRVNRAITGLDPIAKAASQKS